MDGAKHISLLFSPFFCGSVCGSGDSRARAINSRITRRHPRAPMLKLRHWLFFLFCGVSLAAAAQLPDFTDLVERQGPAVVNISTTQSVRNPLLPQIPNLQEDDPFFEFFRRFIPNPGPREFQTQSL